MPAIHDLKISAAAPKFPPSQSRRRAWFGPFAEGEAAAYRHLLILRFAVLNLVALALLGAAWPNDRVTLLLDGASTRLVAPIAVVFGA